MLPVRSRGTVGAVVRVRSASFTGSFAANNTRALAPKQYRPLTRLTAHPSRGFRRTPKAISVHLSTRARSSWGDVRPPYGPLVGSRSASSLHRHDCRWANAPGDLKYVPRDETCRQCRRESESSVEWLDHEGVWQRKLKFWKDFLDKEPYEALFGGSNAMLKGENWETRFNRAFEAHKEMRTALLQSLKLGVGGARPMSTSTDKPQTSKAEDSKAPSANATSPSPDDHGQASRDHTVDIPVKKSYDTSPDSNHYHWGHGKWTRRSTDEQGYVVEETSEEYVFDPISMRMVLKPETSSIGKLEKTTVKSEAVPKTTAPKEPSMTASTSIDAETYPWPNDKSFDHLEIADNVNGELVKTKETLESSWRMESQSRPRTTASEESDSAVAEAMAYGSAATLRGCHRSSIEGSHADALAASAGITRNESPGDGASNPRYDAQSAPVGSSAAPTRDNGHGHRAKKFLSRRARAFTAMSTSEIKTHRTALLDLFRRRQNPQAAPRSPADQKLDDEVKSMKLKMADFEGKWGRDTSSVSAKVPIAASTGQIAQKISPTSTETHAYRFPAEGDLSPTATTYAHADRWYKKSATHARAQKDDLHDRKLVKDIRSIYEEAYGPIATDHKQGTLLPGLEKYEERLGPTLYTFEPNGETDYTSSMNKLPAKTTAASDAAQNDSAYLKKYEDKTKQIYKFEPSAGGDHKSIPLVDTTPNDAIRPSVPETEVTPLDALPKVMDRLEMHRKRLEDLQGQLEAQVEAERQYYARKDRLAAENVPEAANTTTAPPHVRYVATENVSAPRQIPIVKAESPKKIIGRSEGSHPQNKPTEGHSTLRPQSSIGNYASPTGFYRDLDADLGSEAAVRPAYARTSGAPRGAPVRREEPVFSGSKGGSDGWRGGASKREKRNDRREGRQNRGVFKQMLLSSTIIGAFCYATGVTIELLRAARNDAPPKSTTFDVSLGVAKDDGEERHRSYPVPSPSNAANEWARAVQHATQDEVIGKSEKPRVVPEPAEATPPAVHSTIVVNLAPLALVGGLVWLVSRYIGK